MLIRKHSEKVLTAAWCLILAIYWAAILFFNFAGAPRFYCTDMYSDMKYAEAVWEHKSIAPEGWVFGNQRYAVATPVLASVFYGLTGDHRIAMAIATCLMGLATVLSFCWMLRPLFSKLHQRLAAVVAFMSVILLSGDTIFLVNGWQLFFTMCSYYACYAITMFLAFGCYLRRSATWSRKTWAVLIFTCLMSIGTGIQSLRQTIIMTCPIAAMEALALLGRLRRKQPLMDQSLLVSSALVGSNLLGIALGKLLPVEQTTIYGSMNLNSLSEITSSIVPSLKTVTELFAEWGKVAAVIFLLIGIYIIYRIIKERSITADPMILCSVLVLTGAAAILFIDIVTTMEIRNIYYFPLFALMAMWFVWLYTRPKLVLQICGGALVCLCFLLTCTDKTKLTRHLKMPNPNHPIYTVVEDLKQQGITTVYSSWNCCEYIAVASDFTIDAGFWGSRVQPFRKIDYLCDPSETFDADSTQCVYVFERIEFAEWAIAAAAERGVELKLMKYYPELNFYIYTADVELMH